ERQEEELEVGAHGVGRPRQVGAVCCRSRDSPNEQVTDLGYSNLPRTAHSPSSLLAARVTAYEAASAPWASSSRSTRRRSFPVGEYGSSSRNCITPGILVERNLSLTQACRSASLTAPPGC